MRSSGSSSWRRVALALALVVAGIAVISVPSAIGAYDHPAAGTQFATETLFGPDGTTATAENTFGPRSVDALGIDGQGRRLYALRPRLYNPLGNGYPPQVPRGIYAFDLSTPGAYGALGGAFPIPLTEPISSDYMAVDEAEGNVYYLEGTDQTGEPSGRLYSWDSSGNPRPGFPVEVDHAQSIAVDPLGYVWVCCAPAFPPTFAYKYDPEDGSLIEAVDVSIPGLSRYGGIAFDRRTGDMWVRTEGEGGTHSVKFTAASGYRAHEPPILTPGAGFNGSLAIDGENGTVYVPTPHAIYVFTETGDLVETLGLGKFHLEIRPAGETSFHGIAFDEATGSLYVVDERSSVNSVYDVESRPAGNVGVWPAASVPDVETTPPSSVGHAGATLTGHLAPDGGPVTSCKFEYVTKSEFEDVRVVTVSHATGGDFGLGGVSFGPPIPFDATSAEVEEAISPEHASVSGPPGGPWRVELSGPLAGKAAALLPVENGLTPRAAEVEVEWPAKEAPCVPAASPESPIASATDVSAEVSGLETGTTYRYRLSAADANGRNLGTDQIFTVNPSLVSTGPASEVQPEGATLNGSVDPEGLETTYYFEYGPNIEYGQTSSAPPGTSLGTSEAGAKPASDPVAGLSPGTTYHYRLVAVNAKGTSFGVDRTFATLPAVKGVQSEAATEIQRTGALLHGSLDPDGLETTYYFQWGKTRRYGSASATPPGTDLGTTSPGSVQLSAPAAGLQPDTTYHFRLAAANSRGTTYGPDLSFHTLPAVKGVASEPASEVGTTSATLHGELDPDGFATTYYFQWGKTPSYGHEVPLAPGEDVGSASPGAVQLEKALENLEPGTTYHFRLVGVNGFGTTFGADRSFETPQPPSIEGFSAANVTATGAELEARIDPHGYATTYRFEYGTTTAYGSQAPVPDGSLGPSSSPESVAVALGGLQGLTYHFRLVAESQWGTTRSEDQTFGFNPPSCPNAGVRQQTGAAYLPDCRAYELVIPARAGGPVVFPLAPSSSLADNRLAFGGSVRSPEVGDPPTGGFTPNLFVASRTTNGWITRYVGQNAKETAEPGGKPVRTGAINSLARIIADRSLSRFLTWDGVFPTEVRSYAPYAWDNEGNSLGRLPTDAEQVPGALSERPTEGGFLGDMLPSPDFSHYVFSSIRQAFAAGGLTESPGSAYDNDLATGSVQIVSKTPSGEDIPLDSHGEEREGILRVGGDATYVKVPAVSTDGSHILMSTAAPAYATHLYMRVDDALSYEVSVGQDGLNHGVTLAGTSADGSEVFFATAVQMTPDDHDSSVDLYRWAENGGAPTLTRISSGAEGESGDSDGCNGGWIGKCGVEAVPTPSPGPVAFGENAGPSPDSAIAAGGGYAYFYSPEQLDLGARGVPGKRNLYLWHEGAVRYVATIDPVKGIEHINVSRDGSHMGFVTKTRLGTYDNAGRPEMYVYDARSGALHCVSCRPDGQPPSSDVEGAQNGIFMADDGRAFFSTEDALVARDANGVTDVYEYVNGRPQLISSGAGTERPNSNQHPGLVGVTADGTNAFFFTTQTYVPQDENGPFFKFYDARVNGGFPYQAPPAPCVAADECHGEGSEAPGAAQLGSGASLGSGGNVSEAARRHHRHKHRRHRRRRHGHRRSGR